MPASDQTTAILPDLSPIRGREIEARFDGELMSSDGGLLVLREVEQRLGIAGRLAACIRDPRAPERIVHGLDEIIRFRMLMIAAGYEDGNDADALRTDPLFKLAMDRLPEHGDLCSQSTVSRTENLPDRHALLRMGRALVDHYCQSFRQVPRRFVLDIDDTFDAVQGGQQLRLFNAHYDEYGFQPIVVFDGEGRMITALLRPASRPTGRQIVFWLRRLIAALRDNWPRGARSGCKTRISGTYNGAGAGPHLGSAPPCFDDVALRLDCRIRRLRSARSGSPAPPASCPARPALASNVRTSSPPLRGR